MTQRPINVLLDTSAVLAFCDGTAIGVGEIIAEVDAEGYAFGIPLSCLVVARAEVRDEGLLDLLLSHPACRLMDSATGHWPALARAYQLVGRLDVAAAVVLAEELDVQILTRRPGWYVKLVDGGPIIEV